MKGVAVKIGSKTTIKVSAKINVVTGYRVSFIAGVSGCLAVTTELKALCVLQQAAKMTKMTIDEQPYA